jgi:hypothetical protein
MFQMSNVNGWKVDFDYYQGWLLREHGEMVLSKVGKHSKGWNEQGENDPLTVRSIDGDGTPYLRATCANDEAAFAGFLSYCERMYGCVALEIREDGEWRVFFE